MLNVVAGAELIEPASARERDTLRALGAQATARLGCQLRMRAGLDSAAELVLALPVRSNSSPSQ
jgi:ferredoxin